MPENKADADPNTPARPPPNKDADETSEFVEVDPTGRYGRYDEVLGKGAFKTVYRAFDEVDGIEVAWNQVKVQDVLQSSEDLERLYSEVHLLKSLKHKNIIKFYNSWVDTKTKNVNFITEIFTSGTLRQYRKRHKHVDIKAVKNWSRQILRGLLYLHSHDPPIIHRDLKCDNIFVNGNQGEIKIGDLGLAAILRQAHAAHSVLGTPEFMAPELYEEEYNELVDIYSFGMCVLEMVTFEYPYSECTNAAQIYKKVTAGKKPAVFEKVKDPAVRAFVEKCLAPASKRLPARELLMDPFLQCEGDREASDLTPSISFSKSRTDDMMDLGSITEEQMSMSMGQKVLQGDARGTRIQGDERASMASASTIVPKTSKSCKSESEDERHDHHNYAHDKYSKEDRPRRSRDFRVKGKRRDDDTIYLRLRIADPDGQTRNIHFPFHTEADTAMSVATEMVAELDLSDQDVTTIAEMMDTEILALVPEWRPGVAVDETGGTDGKFVDDENLGTAPGDYDIMATLSSEGSVIEQHQSGQKAHSHSPKVLTLATSPPRVEGTMHGRFEEVTYHSKAEHSRRGSDIPPVFSSDSSDAREGPWELGNEHVTPKSTMSVADSGSPTHAVYDSSKDMTDSESCHANSTAFNNLVEMRRKGGAVQFCHGAWESMSEANQRFDQIESAISHVDETENGNEEVSLEMRKLAMRQKQELEELQRRHEQAVLALKNRHRHKASQNELQRRSMSPDGHNYASLLEDYHQHNELGNVQSVEPQISASYEQNRIDVGTGSRNLPSEVEDVQKLGQVSSLESSDLDILFVGGPKAYGLGHNLQGHILIEPHVERRSSSIIPPESRNAEGQK